MRALAIIAVVLIHTAPGGLPQVFIRPFINFAVATFIFLSGYLTHPVTDWKQFYLKRISRVVIPYVIWTALYTVSHREPARILYNLLTGQANGTLYYIFVYVELVLLTPVIARLARSRFRWFGWLVAPTWLLVTIYTPLLLWGGLAGIFAIIRGLCCFGWFTYYYLGLMLGNGWIKKIPEIRKLMMLYVISLAIQMVEGYWWFDLGESNCGSQLKLSALLSCVLFLFMACAYLKDSRYGLSRILVQFGNASFGIYLSHILIMMVLRHMPYYNSLPYIVNSVIVLEVSYCCVVVGKKICGKRISRWLGLV